VATSGRVALSITLASTLRPFASPMAYFLFPSLKDGAVRIVRGELRVERKYLLKAAERKEGCVLLNRSYSSGHYIVRGLDGTLPP